MTATIDNKPTLYRLRIARLDRNRPHDIEISLSKDEYTALAKDIGARKLEKLRFEGVLHARDVGWDLQMSLGYSIVQACVISDLPVKTRYDGEISRKYRPEDEALPVDLTLEVDFDDSVEVLGNEIDLWALLHESLLLTMPPFPRHADYIHAENDDRVYVLGDDDDEDEDKPSPFAALQNLQFDKPQDGS